MRLGMDLHSATIVIPQYIEIMRRISLELVYMQSHETNSRILGV